MNARYLQILSRQTFWRIAGVAFWLLLGATTTHAVEIGEPQWGFDGRIRLDRFNLLTIPLDNPSPVTETFVLEMRKYMGGPIDAPIVQSITMGPGQRRIVQLYPYVSADYNTSWTVRCGRKTLTIDQPRSARRGARVLLESSDVVSDAGGSLRRFPAMQFPPFVTATDTLEAVVLDHVPTWDEPRRQAFLDWLYKGGAVFVLQTPTGKFPEFSGPLSVLNTPLERVNYGSGMVQRVPMPRRDLTRIAAKELWAQMPNRMTPPPDPTAQPGMATDDDDDEDDPSKPYSFSDGGRAGAARSFLDSLMKMTKPEHNWLLLHSMFWVYILLIFPGCFLVGQQRNDFRIVYATLAGVVVVFSLAFGYVGRRGYGEETAVNSVAIVQPLPDGMLDVAQWSNAFVKSGAIYEIRHHGSGTLYSTCQEDEAVRGKIENGNQALFEVDIPPFSSRAFAHRTKVAGTLPPVAVSDFTLGDTGLSKLTIRVDETFPQTEEMYLLYGNRFYSVARRDNEISLRSSIGTVPAFLRLDQSQNYYPGIPMFYGNDQETPDDLYRGLVPTLITRSLNLRSQSDAEALRWSPGRVRLMYVASLSPELLLDNPRFKTQKGKALYCVDLELQEMEPRTE